VSIADSVKRNRIIRPPPWDEHHGIAGSNLRDQSENSVFTPLSIARATM